MQVILLQDVKKVGSRGTLITVADGYANNVLIPKKLALPATPDHVKRFQKEREGEESRQLLNASLAKKTLMEIEGREVKIEARSNDAGTLFESIHLKRVAEAIKKQLGLSVAEGDLTLVDGPIKKLGSHRVEVKVHGISAKLLVIVEKAER